MDKQTMVYPYNGILLSYKDTLTHTHTKNFKWIQLSKRSQSQKALSYMISTIWHCGEAKNGGDG